MVATGFALASAAVMEGLGRRTDRARRAGWVTASYSSCTVGAVVALAFVLLSGGCVSVFTPDRMVIHDGAATCAPCRSRRSPWVSRSC